MRSASSWLCGELLAAGVGDVEDLAPQRQDAWVARSRACLAEPPAESPSTMKISVPAAARSLQSASLPGSRSLRVARLPADLLLLCGGVRRSSARSIDPFEQPVACGGLVGEPVVEGVAHGILDDPRGFRRWRAGPWSGPGTPARG